MPLEEKINYLSTCSYQNKLNFLLANTCAPVIRNLTCANTLTAKCGSYLNFVKELEDTDLLVRCLCNNFSKEVLIIYREDALKKCLKVNKSYLKEFGYETCDLEYCLNKLSQRFNDFYSNNGLFPHELGIFLNYPIDDIKGFISNKGKNSLFSKYWKVYSNLNVAKETFKKFDEAIEFCLRQIVDGQNICDIIA